MERKSVWLELRDLWEAAGLAGIAILLVTAGVQTAAVELLHLAPLVSLWSVIRMTFPLTAFIAIVGIYSLIKHAKGLDWSVYDFGILLGVLLVVTAVTGTFS